LLTIHGEVDITRSDGTQLSGRGLSADIRRRGWEFEADVSGDVVEEDDEPAEGEAGSAQPAAGQTELSETDIVFTNADAGKPE
jgi:hypothetical protein